MRTDNDNIVRYKVGGLLYMPAFQPSVAEKIKNGKYPCLTSIAFCLEDTVSEKFLTEAENFLHKTLREIQALELVEAERPLIFVRVRTPEHMEHIVKLYNDVQEILTGFILPKFDMSNALRYVKQIKACNKDPKHPLYVMPILESREVASAAGRIANLYAIKDILDSVHPYVLNLRVGGNDFSNLYGLRRPINKTIYDINVIRDILVDIVNVFSEDYVISSPVWEYFGKDANDEWAQGLRSELELDLVNGFIGKTAIHPSQLPIIYNSLKVSPSDYSDALKVLHWDNKKKGVAKSSSGKRMNEVSCHYNWAKRIRLLGEIYGIAE